MITTKGKNELYNLIIQTHNDVVIKLLRLYANDEIDDTILDDLVAINNKNCAAMIDYIKENN